MLDQFFDLRKITQYFLLAALPALCLFVVSFLMLRSSGFEVMQIIRDPAQITNVSSFLGFLSNIGVWFWVSAFAIALFSAVNIHQGVRCRLLILMSILSITLAVDDLFLIHDRYIEQNYCYAFYGINAILILVFHFKMIIKIHGLSFLLAGGFLALSILTDLIQDYLPYSYEDTQIVEEGFKFMGAATWLYFSCCVSSQKL